MMNPNVAMETKTLLVMEICWVLTKYWVLVRGKVVVFSEVEAVDVVVVIPVAVGEAVEVGGGVRVRVEAVSEIFLDVALVAVGKAMVVTHV